MLLRTSQHGQEGHKEELHKQDTLLCFQTPKWDDYILLGSCIQWYQLSESCQMIIGFRSRQGKTRGRLGQSTLTSWFCRILAPTLSSMVLDAVPGLISPLTDLIASYYGDVCRLLGDTVVWPSHVQGGTIYFHRGYHSLSFDPKKTNMLILHYVTTDLKDVQIEVDPLRCFEPPDIDKILHPIPLTFC